MARRISLTTEMDYNSAGMTSRNLNSYILAHSTLSSWIQFYHQPYKFDWAEATQKAIERKAKEEGKNFITTADYILNSRIKEERKKQKDK